MEVHVQDAKGVGVIRGCKGPTVQPILLSTSNGVKFCVDCEFVTENQAVLISVDVSHVLPKGISIFKDDDVVECKIRRELHSAVIGSQCNLHILILRGGN